MAKKTISRVNPDLTPRTALDPGDHGGVYMGPNLQKQEELTDDLSSTSQNDPASGSNNMEKMEKLAELKASTLQDLEIFQPKGRPEQSTSEKVFKIIVRNLLFYISFSIQTLQ